MIKKVLYWPGLGQDMTILNVFRKELCSRGYEIDIINLEYDKGDLAPDKWEQIQSNKYDWWIGISLGASLLYYAYNYVNKSMRPCRITLINPFSSRKLLSNEKSFDMSKQWDFSPIDNICFVENIDMIISLNDCKVPIYHGIKLLNFTKSSNKNILFLETGHVIEEDVIQKELVDALIIGEKGIKNTHEKKFNYCYFYKQ